MLRVGLVRTPLADSRRELTRVMVGVLLIAAIGMLLLPARVLGSVRTFPALPEINVDFVMLKEREAGNIDTTYVVSFLPRDVKEVPRFELLARDGPERLDRDSLPAGATVASADYTSLRYTLVLSSPSPFTATFNTFHFPGWAARLDGEPVPLAADVPYGRITAWVPAGRHRLVPGGL